MNNFYQFKLKEKKKKKIKLSKNQEILNTEI